MWVGEARGAVAPEATLLLAARGWHCQFWSCRELHCLWYQSDVECPVPVAFGLSREPNCWSQLQMVPKPSQSGQVGMSTCELSVRFSSIYSLNQGAAVVGDQSANTSFKAVLSSSSLNLPRDKGF